MKKLFIALIGMLSVCGVSAQEFSPGQQAKGQIDSKSVSVDYATGIFHYSLPLYSLKSGEFELPVSLDYSGREDPNQTEDPGLLGSNWVLNMGGVVTRMMRGRNADEYKDIEDTESDIFVAVLGKTSVNFILIDKKPIPLEQTNVRIEYSGWPEIDEWKITDDTGNIYYFRQKEWTSNLNVESVSGDNGISDRTYISAWYLSEIHPLNGIPIRYGYYQIVESKQPDFKPNIKNRSYPYNNGHGRIIEIEYRDGTTERYNLNDYEDLMKAAEQRYINIFNNKTADVIEYRYGQPMKYRPFRFQDYIPKIKKSLEDATIAIYNDRLLIKLSNLSAMPISSMYNEYIDPLVPAYFYKYPKAHWDMDFQVLGLIKNLAENSEFTLRAIHPIEIFISVH